MRFILIFSFSIFWGYCLSAKQNVDGISLIEGDWISTESLNFLDHLDSYKIICASEFHRTEIALSQKKAFIEYLSSNHSLDKLVIEYSYGYGFAINYYLSTGDTTFLREVAERYWAFDKMNKNSKVVHNSFDFFRWLYSFNQSSAKKIKVVGIDLDQIHKSELELWLVHKRISDEDLIDDFKDSYQSLSKIIEKRNLKRGLLEEWLNSFEKDIKSFKGEREIKDYLQKIATAVHDELSYRSKVGTKQKRNYREEVLIRNFKREVKPEEVVYVQFGAGHLFLSESYLSKKNGFDYLMTALNKNPDYSGKIVSIIVHYESCDMTGNHSSCRPKALENDPGYWFHEWIDGLENDTIHDELISSLNKKNSVIELNKHAGDISILANLYQFLVIIF